MGDIDENVFLKIDGSPVDVVRYGDSGHPTCEDAFLDGRLINACGNTAQGQSEFRVSPNMDNYTPWQCGVPYSPNRTLDRYGCLALSYCSFRPLKK